MKIPLPYGNGSVSVEVPDGNFAGIIEAHELPAVGDEDITINGWAIECRINAEDPMNDFAPSHRRIVRYQSPGGPGMRVDSGAYTGYTISPYYDSMVSKLISWGEHRPHAI